MIRLAALAAVVMVLAGCEDDSSWHSLEALRLFARNCSSQLGSVVYRSDTAADVPVFSATCIQLPTQAHQP